MYVALSGWNSARIVDDITKGQRLLLTMYRDFHNFEFFLDIRLLDFDKVTFSKCMHIHLCPNIPKHESGKIDFYENKILLN